MISVAHWTVELKLILSILTLPRLLTLYVPLSWYPSYQPLEKDPLLTWFHSYLTGRSQRVVINGTSSRWTAVGSGVPQGSQLGPILFLLFVNDMPNVVTSATMAMFADDSKCYKVTNHHSDYLHLQQDLDALSNWSLRNELFFQPTKCSNLRISRKRLSPPRSYVLNDINVELTQPKKI